jgi:hypothetical protein
MVKNLSQYLKDNDVVVDFDPNKPRILLYPKPGVTKEKVQTVLESYLEKIVYKAVNSSFVKC